ncbi:MAG: CapA family protein [Anaerolineales bacterium]
MNMPQDIWYDIDMPWPWPAILRFIMRLIRVFGLWRRPYVHDPDAPGLLPGLYYAYKTRYPVLKPQRGSRTAQRLEADKRRRGGYVALRMPRGNAYDTLRLGAVGDLMISPGLAKSGHTLYAEVGSTLFSRDISFANLESTLPVAEHTPLRFTAGQMPRVLASPEEMDVLLGRHPGPFDVVNLVHNHIADEGVEGLKATVRRAEVLGSRVLSPGLSDCDEDLPLILNKKGFAVGFVAATYSLNRHSFGERAEGTVPVVHVHRMRKEMGWEAIEEQIAHCRDAKCDITILSLHWGMEYELYPTEKQARLARWAAERGVDCILGHHAHMAQRMEILDRGEKRVPVFYGLGNLTNPFGAWHTSLSLMALVEYARTSEGVRLFGLDVVPVVRRSTGEERIVIVPLAQLMREELCRKEAVGVERMEWLADNILGPAWRRWEAQ